MRLYRTDWDNTLVDLARDTRLARAGPGFEAQLQALPNPAPAPSVQQNAMVKMITQGSRRASERIAAIESLALQASEFARMEYDFLYDKATKFAAIGYNISERRRDLSYYDLLASEARLSSFVAIAARPAAAGTLVCAGDAN